jgi:hypothetical protein
MYAAAKQMDPLVNAPVGHCDDDAALGLQTKEVGFEAAGCIIFVACNTTGICCLGHPH